MLVEPDGQVDLLSWGHFVSPSPSYALHPGHEFFASSANGTGSAVSGNRNSETYAAVVTLTAAR